MKGKISWVSGQEKENKGEKKEEKKRERNEKEKEREKKGGKEKANEVTKGIYFPTLY